MVNTRPSSSAIAKSNRRTKPFLMHNDLFEDSLRAAGIQGVEADTKLYVSNLDRGVTNEDIRELFSKLGDLKHYAVQFDIEQSSHNAIDKLNGSGQSNGYGSFQFNNVYVKKPI
uniref:THO complex subunit 4D-like n=2 Tax=Cicer arietinum TaxID=3827 RepID=A0A1S2Z8W1_CICAR|nr:THO complex subunit 4D-like [Cicer arietinum]